MKNLLKLKGAQTLSKRELQTVNGGIARPCPVGQQVIVLNLDEEGCSIHPLFIWAGGNCYYCN